MKRQTVVPPNPAITAMTRYAEETSPLVEEYRAWLQVGELEADAIPKATSIIAEVKAIKRKAEEAKKEITSPLRGVIKTVDTKVKPLIDACDQLEAHIKRLITSYESEQRAKALKAAEKEAKKLEKKGHEDLANDIRQQALVAPIVEAQGVTFRDNWKAEIKDEVLFMQWVLEDPKTRLGLVSLDVSPLTTFAKGNHDSVPVPGVRFFNDRIVAVRS